MHLAAPRDPERIRLCAMCRAGFQQQHFLGRGAPRSRKVLVKADAAPDGIICRCHRHKDTRAASGMHQPFVGECGQCLPDRVPVHAKAGRKGRFGGQFVTSSIQTLRDVIPQRVCDGFPDRGGAGHVMKT